MIQHYLEFFFNFEEESEWTPHNTVLLGIYKAPFLTFLNWKLGRVLNSGYFFSLFRILGDIIFFEEQLVSLKEQWFLQQWNVFAHKKFRPS